MNPLYGPASNLAGTCLGMSAQALSGSIPKYGGLPVAIS